MKFIFRYFRKTINYGIIYGKDKGSYYESIKDDRILNEEIFDI